jgi:hypothetical protein
MIGLLGSSGAGLRIEAAFGQNRCDFGRMGSSGTGWRPRNLDSRHKICSWYVSKPSKKKPAKPDFDISIIRLRDGGYAVKAKPNRELPLIISGFETPEEARAWVEGVKRRMKRSRP